VPKSTNQKDPPADPITDRRLAIRNRPQWTRHQWGQQHQALSYKPQILRRIQYRPAPGHSK